MVEPSRTLYALVAEHLHESIAAGRFAVGQPIPSTSRLCQQFGVSSTVVRAAVNQLRAAGLVTGQPGKAVYVVATPAQLAHDRVTVEQLTDRIDVLLGGLAQAVGSAPELAALVAELRQRFAALRARVVRG